VSTIESEPLFELREGESWRDPWSSYRRLQETPVQSFDPPGFEPFWVLSRFADVFDAVRDTSTFSSAQGLTPDSDSMALFEGRAAPIVMMDPPEHTTMRRLVSRPMTPRAVAALEPAIGAFIDERLDVLEGDGGGDIVELLFKPLPSFVVAHFLGVPDQDRNRFDGWTNAIVAATASGELASVPEAALDLFTYATELIGRRRREPSDDLISELLNARVEVSEDWIVGFVFTMVTGGNDTTSGLLGGAAELLTNHPGQRNELLNEPGRIRPSIDELLRLTSPVQNLARTTTRSVDVGGVTIPSGTKVLLVYGAANRDEREFGPSAQDLDVQRQVSRMLSFGYGPHHCLGAPVARLQAGIALERLLDRFPRFAVDSEAGRFAPGHYVRRYESLPFIASS
jgi:cytochrome P450 family 130